MVSLVSSIGGGLNAYGRAMTGAMRSLADLAQGEDPSLRGVAGMDESADADSGGGVDQSRQSPPSPALDIVQAQADMIAARAQVQAGIALVRAGDSMLGSLLDTIA